MADHIKVLKEVIVTLMRTDH